MEKSKPDPLRQAELKAGEFLCDSDLTVEEQLKLIAKHEDTTDMIDNVEGVVVWEKVEHQWQVGEFLDYIGYPY